MGKLARFIVQSIGHKLITFALIITFIWFLVDYSIMVTGTTPYDYLLSVAQSQPKAYDEYLVRIAHLGLKQEQIIIVHGDYNITIATGYQNFSTVIKKIAEKHGVPPNQVKILLYNINRSLSYGRIPIVGYKVIVWGTQRQEQLTIVDAAPRRSNNYIVIKGKDNVVRYYIRTIDYPKGTVIVIDSNGDITTTRKVAFIKPWYIRLANTFYRVFTLDFGYSNTYNKPVVEVIATYLPFTLGLVGLAFLIGSMAGFILGLYLSRKRGTVTEASILTITLGIRAMPVFWLGMIVVYIFAYVYGWFPSSLVTGFTHPTDIVSYIAAWFWATILPALVLSKIYAVQYLLSVRGLVLDEWTQDYIVTLRGVGFSDSYIAEKYVIRTVAPPIVTLMAIDLGFVFGGAVVTETVFNYPGIGSLMYHAIRSRDSPLIIGIFTIITIAVLVAITVAELLYSWLDPRIRR